MWKEGEDDTVCPGVYPSFCYFVESSELLMMPFQPDIGHKKIFNSFLPPSSLPFLTIMRVFYFIK